MDTVKMVVVVDRETAIKAGRNQYGKVVVDVDVSQLSAAQRDILAGLPLNYIDRSDVANPYAAHPHLSDQIVLPPVGDASMESVRILLDARPEALSAYQQAQEEKIRKEDENVEAKCTEIMNGEKRNEILRKIVAGNSFTNATPFYGDKYTQWWDAHQVEFASELDVLRAEIELKKKAEEERIDQLCRERAEKVIAAGIEGLLQRDDDNEWEARRLSESEYGRHYGPVKALRERAVADAERRNAEERTTRKNQINAWVSAHGSENQKGRHALNLLPVDEVLDAMRDEAFISLDSFPRYQKIKRDDLDHDEYCEAGISCDVNAADHLTPEQYDQFAAITRTVAKPECKMTGAQVEALAHVCECKGSCDATLSRMSARVTLQVGAFTFTREYAL